MVQGSSGALEVGVRSDVRCPGVSRPQAGRGVPQYFVQSRPPRNLRATTHAQRAAAGAPLMSMPRERGHEEPQPSNLLPPPQQQCPRGPAGKELLKAVDRGSTGRVLALLSSGRFDIDEGTPNGFTPLILAAVAGYTRIVRILLNKRANVTIAADGGLTALHASAQGGHLAVTKLLVKAGAPLEAVAYGEVTALLIAAELGYSDIMTVLIEAGANPDSRRPNGDTPLSMAAVGGHLNAVRVLLLGKANPLLARKDESRHCDLVPLERAAYNGHSGVVRELLRQLGIGGCGGESAGQGALNLATEQVHVDVMALLTEAGVVDTGMALVAASAIGREASVKFLLQQHLEPLADRDGYINNTLDQSGATPLFASTTVTSPRIARLLIDAGADTTLSVPLKSSTGCEVKFTPLAFTILTLRDKKIGGMDITEDQLNRLEAMRRLLLRVEAVHAVSWLWPTSASRVAYTAESTTRVTTPPTPQVTLMLPVMRRRARSPGMLWAPVLR